MLKYILIALAILMSSAAAQTLGAFVPFGSASCSQEANLLGMEAWLNRAPSSMPLPTYPEGSTWAELTANFTGSTNLAAERYACNPRRPYIWAIPLTVWGTPLSAVAGGGYDSIFRLVATQIAEYQPHAIVRLGWEMNGPWYSWGVNQQGAPSAYIAAFRHIAPIFRGLGLKIDWNVAPCGSWCTMSTTAFWPGRAYVDYIGMDIYDRQPSPDLATAKAYWAMYRDGPDGLRWHIQFAARQSKPASYPEWGLYEIDSPYFIHQMSAWIKAARVAYSDYWDFNATKVHSQLYPESTLTPLSAAAFLKAWSN